MKEKLSFTIFLVTLFLGNVFAKEDISFEHFSRAQGLSNNSVRQVFQDQRGFLWFGTLNGLNKYDGVSIRNYQHQKGIPGSITSNRIYGFFEDGKGYLWVVTFDGAALRYNDQTDTFLDLSSFLSEQDRKGVLIKEMYRCNENEIYCITTNKGCIRVLLQEDGSIARVNLYNVKNVLPSNKVNFIYHDKYSVTWIGTKAGLVRVRGDEIKVVSNPYGVQLRNPSLPVKCYCDLDSIILLGTDQYGIYSYNRSNNLFQYRSEFENTVDALVSSIGLLKDNQLYITTIGNGFFHCNRDLTAVRQYRTGENGLNDSGIYSPVVDRYGLIWFMTAQRGITQFNPQSKQFRYFPLNAEKRQSIGDPEKLKLFEDSNGDLWIGIYGGGICKFNREMNSFDQYMYDPSDPFSLSSDYVLSIYEDDSKNLWIGMLKGGVNKISLRKKFFKVLKPVPDAQMKIENEVRSVLTDRNGKLWIGTKRGKIFCYDSANKLIGIIPDRLGNAKKYSEAGVYSLMEDHAGNLWIGTKGEGIYIVKGAIDKIGKSQYLNAEVFHFKNDPDRNSLSNNDVYDLLEIDDQNVWIATHNGGLDVLKNPLSSPIFTNYSPNDTLVHSISSNQLRCFLRDRYNNVWIGTTNGLNFVAEKYIHSDKKVFEAFKSDDEDSCSISHNDVICLAQTENGNIWAGTFGGGLNLTENFTNTTSNLKWKNFSVKHGIGSNVIYKLLEDEKSNLWISSDYGLSKLDQSRFAFENYYTHERVESNSYSENSGAIQRNGKFVFGQLNGFTSFWPDSIVKKNKKFPVYLTGFYIDNEEVLPGKGSVLSKTISNTSKIVLKYNQNYITFRYSLLDFAKPGKINYAYILENFDKNWNYVGNSKSAIYKGLPPGDYVFKVKGTNSDDVWNETPAVIHVVVLPPWWKTTYAIIAYILVFLGIVYLLGSVVLRQLQLKNQIKLEQENTDNKLRFYTNISHELKTPLTLILGPAEELLSSRNLVPSAKYKAGEIVKNAKRLLELIDQLMDFRKIQKGHLDLKVKQIDITKLFRNIYFSFLPLAEKRKINFVFEPGEEPVTGYVDVEKIEKIVFNLVSNAFKHTPRERSIKLTLVNDQKFSFAVVDQGKGIDPDELPHIFQRFTLFTKSEHVTDSSSGIGLSLTKELVTLHKGSIEVESKPGVGSRFTITIPIEIAAYSTDEICEESINRMQILDHTNEFIGEETNVPEHDPELEKRYAGADAPKVLIIEDNEDLRNYLYYNLKPLYKVIVAEDGKKGVQVARDEFPDLIICDVMMPEMNGIEVVRCLKMEFNTSHIPIILLTAKSALEHKQEGFEAGADAYITKPFSLKLLKIQIQNLIEQRKKLMQKYGEKVEVAPVELGGTNADQAFLTKVISIIEEHMADPDFNVNAIVDEFGYGRTVFYKKIKAISGYAPNDFIRIIRMKKAASALKNTDLSIAEVSTMIGLNDANYFSRTFKKHFGKTPSEYRRN